MAAPGGLELVPSGTRRRGVPRPWLTWTWDSVLAACAAGASHPAAGPEETP